MYVKSVLMKKCLLTGLVAGMFLFTACGSVPLTGRKQVLLVSDQEVLEMLSVISGSARTELTDQQYQQVGRAQRTGGSFLLQCRMNEGTASQMYVIPSLSIVMAGDSMYVLPHTFSEEFGSIFDGLEQRPAPMG